MRFINVGFNNMINAEKVVSLVNADSSPSKRMVQDAKYSGRAIDCTSGRKTKCVIVTDSDHIILSALMPETLAGRLACTADDHEGDPEAE